MREDDRFNRSKPNILNAAVRYSTEGKECHLKPIDEAIQVVVLFT